MNSRKPEEICHKIAAIKRKGYNKYIILENKCELKTTRSACVGIRDEVLIEKNSAWVVCRNGKAKIIPPYLSKDQLIIDNNKLNIIIKEIT